MFRLDVYIFVIFVTSEKKVKIFEQDPEKSNQNNIKSTYLLNNYTAQFKPLEILSSEQLISYSKGQCHKNGMVFYHMRCCVN